MQHNYVSIIKDSYEKVRQEALTKNNFDTPDGIDLFYNKFLYLVAVELDKVISYTFLFKVISYKYLSCEEEAVKGLIWNVEKHLPFNKILEELSSSLKKIRPGLGALVFGDKMGDVYEIFIAILKTRKVKHQECSQKTHLEENEAHKLSQLRDTNNSLSENNELNDLMEASEKGYKQVVKYLLEEKAASLTKNVNLANYQIAIQKAVKKLEDAIRQDNNYSILGEHNYLVDRYVGILQLLICWRIRFTRDDLNNVFWSLYSDYHKCSNFMERDKIIKQLIIKQLKNLIDDAFNISDEVIVYLAHQLGISGNITLKNNREKELEGMDLDTFLILQIYCFMKLQIDVTFEKKSTNLDDGLLSEFIMNEILILLEAFIIYKQSFIVTYSVLTDEIRLRLLQYQAQKIVEHISNLKENEEILYPVGYQLPSPHCLYAAFSRRRDNIIIRIDNLGQDRGSYLGGDTLILRHRKGGDDSYLMYIENNDNESIKAKVNYLLAQKSLRVKNAHMYFIDNSSTLSYLYLKDGKLQEPEKINPKLEKEDNVVRAVIQRLQEQYPNENALHFKLSAENIQDITSNTSHTQKRREENKYYSCLIGYLPLAEFNNENVVSYIVKLLGSSSSKQAPQLIYTAQFRDKKQTTDLTWLVAKKGFERGHCVVKNYNVGLQTRINTLPNGDPQKEIYYWIREKLSEVAISFPRSKQSESSEVADSSHHAYAGEQHRDCFLAQPKKLIDDFLNSLKNKKWDKVIKQLKQSPTLLCYEFKNDYYIFHYICEYCPDNVINLVKNLIGRDNHLMQLLMSLNRPKEWKPLQLNKMLLAAIKTRESSWSLNCVDLGADINTQDTEKGDKNIPLHWAIRLNHEDVFIGLIDRGANIEAEAIDGSTPLNFAAFYGRPSMTKTLLQLKANIEHVDCAGNTPLHDAALNGNIEVVDILLSYVSKTNIYNKNGQTPRDLASASMAFNIGDKGRYEHIISKLSFFETEKYKGKLKQVDSYDSPNYNFPDNRML
jgi:ankyrin repeat protein